MKKIVFTFLIIVALSKSAFGLDLPMSVGGGGLFGYTFTRYNMEGGNTRSYQNMDRVDYGAFLFFDAKYAAFSIMYQGGISGWEENIVSSSSAIESNGTGSSGSLGFSLAGKYPFTINEKIFWFPKLGVSFHLALMERRKPQGYASEYSRTMGLERTDRDRNDKPYSNLRPWDSFWIDVGAGMDYVINGPFFLRSELLFGFRLQTTHETDSLAVAKKELGIQNPRLAGLTGSPSLNVAIGYRL